MPYRLAVVVGIRSQYIKLAALQPELDRTCGLDCTYIDTGQHYDGVLAGQYVDEYRLHFDKELRCGSSASSPTETFAQMLIRLESTLPELDLDGVVVFGDANTTLAAALAGRRVGLAVAHLEAGVRTGAETPEELNRVVVDRVSSLHLAATDLDLATLQDEGMGRTSVLVGDVVRDLCDAVEPEDLGYRYGLVTIHRAENTRDSAVVAKAICAVERAGLRAVVVFHPRVLRLARIERPDLLGSVLHLESLPHARILRLMKGAQVIVTDSGALQRESFYLERRAVVVQDKPFWRSLIEAGHHIDVAPSGDLDSAVQRALLPAPQGIEFGGHDVAPRVAAALLGWMERR